MVQLKIRQEYNSKFSDMNSGFYGWTMKKLNFYSMDANVVVRNKHLIELLVPPGNKFFIILFSLIY